jgi:hypothetical protein
MRWEESRPAAKTDLQGDLIELLSSRRKKWFENVKQF